MATGLALVLGACSDAPPSPVAASQQVTPELVRLLTMPATGSFACPASLIVGEFVADPEAGTAIVGAGQRYQVRWPPGYAGRRMGNEIEVLDADGAVVAVTGVRRQLGGGNTAPGIWDTCEGIIN